MATNLEGVTKRTDMFYIPVSEILVDWNENGRSTKPKADELTDLKESIRKHGQQNPVVIRKVKEDKGKYRAVLVSGYNRAEAVRLLNEEGVDVPLLCTVQNVNEYEGFLLNIEENLRRRNLSPYDIAIQIRKLKDTFGKTNEEIAEIYNRPSRWVNEHYRLLGLDQKTLNGVHDGRITLRAALELVALPEDQRKVVAKELDEEPVVVKADTPEGGESIVYTEDQAKKTEDLVKRKNRNGKVGRDEVVKAARKAGLKRARGLKDLKEVLEAVGTSSKVGQEILAYLAGDSDEEALIKVLKGK